MLDLFYLTERLKNEEFNESPKLLCLSPNQRGLDRSCSRKSHSLFLSTLWPVNDNDMVGSSLLCFSRVVCGYDHIRGTVVPWKFGPPVSPTIRVRTYVVSGYLGCLDSKNLGNYQHHHSGSGPSNAVNRTVASSKPSVVLSIRLKYVRNFIFDPFLRFFPFDSLGCVPENPCPDCRGVRIAGRPDCRGSTVEEINYFWCPSCHANFCDYHRGDLPGWCAQSNMVLEIKWQCQKWAGFAHFLIILTIFCDSCQNID